VVTLARTQEINPEVRRYLNRLSDLFFTIARIGNFREGIKDVEYERSALVFRTKTNELL
jgi:cob(I)alamin adenosyltransferase